MVYRSVGGPCCKVDVVGSSIGLKVDDLSPYNSVLIPAEHTSVHDSANQLIIDRYQKSSFVGDFESQFGGLVPLGVSIFTKDLADRG